MAFCQHEIMHKSFAVGEREPIPSTGKGWGQELLCCCAGLRRLGKVLQLGWADGNSRKPKRV